MELRSGKFFVPYDLKGICQWQTSHEQPVSTFVDVDPLVQAAVARENERCEQEADDSEGLDVSLRPLLPFL